MDINNSFCSNTAKKIFGNIGNAKLFLIELSNKGNFDLPFKKITRGKNKDQKRLDLDTKGIWQKIVEHWDINLAKPIIRELFKLTDKYNSGQNSHCIMNILLEEWASINLGEISWSFSQGDFDGFVQRLNAQNTTGTEKDEKVKKAAVQYRRIKEINTVRNDFIETLIFNKNENILPTLNHRRGVDFFINGRAFDQKVAKSPTKEFKRDFGENWKEYAIQNPEKVAEYLYKYQDEGRFGCDSRLLVVYLDEEISIENVETIIGNVDLNTPLSINFEYKHNKGKPRENVKNYKVECFIILLHN